MATEQLTLVGIAPAEPQPEPRTYWEHRGPNRWEPVIVRTRGGAGCFACPPPAPGRRARMPPSTKGDA